jgi:ribosomal-protein-alanine N-acetyltransferase
MLSISSTAPGAPARIEPATWRDLNPLRQLEKTCFPKDAWPLWDMIGILTFPNVVRLKAIVDGELAGFIAADVRERKRIAWIATVGVLPEYLGRGIGRALLESCEKQLDTPSVRLNVRSSNRDAIRMYRIAGYQDVGVWPKYYLDGEDAIVMEKTLGSGGTEKSRL